MQDQLAANKAVVTRFNKEVIEKGNMEALDELVSPDFINHTTVPGSPIGIDGLRYYFTQILQPAFPELTVTIYDQIAEGDTVVTRKAFKGKQVAEFMGIAPNGKETTIHVIDIIIVKDGKYHDHWSMRNIVQG